MAPRGRPHFTFNEGSLLQPVKKRGFTAGTEDEGYNSQDVVTCSTAEDGTWGSARFKYPGDWHRAVQIIVQRRMIPEYETHADFYRDAIWHRLNWVADHTGNRDLTEMARMNLLKAELDASDLRKRKADELFEKIQARVREDLEGVGKVDQHELGKWRRLVEGFDGKYREMILTYIDKFYDPKLDHDIDDDDGYDGRELWDYVD